LLVTADARYAGKAINAGCLTLLNEWSTPRRSPL
jgi:hypothetical protein